MGDNIADNAHAGFGRINIGIPHHELFQNIVLNGSGKRRLTGALFLSNHNITGQNWQNRAVHCHADTDIAEINTVKKPVHVLNTINRHTCFTDIADHARMIAIVPSVGR